MIFWVYFEFVKVLLSNDYGFAPGFIGCDTQG